MTQPDATLGVEISISTLITHEKYALLSDLNSRLSGWPKFQPNSPNEEDL
jgi:hypothetical protein